MPKKRHLVTKYSKPQSTVPASLSGRSSVSSSQANSQDGQHERGVNQLLADLRRTALGSPQQLAAASASSVAGTPTVPPVIRRILQLPEPPPLAPRRRRGLRPGIVFTRSGTPGPPPPRSWLSLSVHAPRHSSQQTGAVAANGGGVPRTRALPGAYVPARASLVDMALRGLAVNWEFQREYNRYHLFSLPSRLKAALILYLCLWHDAGVTIADLRAILLPQEDIELVDDTGEPLPSPRTMHEDLRHLDLTGAAGRSLKLRELSELLFPQPPSAESAASAVQDSWDAPGAPDAVPAGIARPLLPNLTHLSLAVSPSSPAPSWRQLLSFVPRLSALTHLSLACWPEPSLTPNAKYASVTPPHGGAAVAYGGTGPYSHSLDGDWSEAVALLRRLAKATYRLEHLDLTGCGGWWAALAADVEANEAGDAVAVDWVADWGKMGTLVLDPGYSLGKDAGIARTDKFREEVQTARRVERHIRARRKGRGRAIEVETGDLPSTGS